jgi:hypothetical protein
MRDHGWDLFGGKRSNEVRLKRLIEVGLLVCFASAAVARPVSPDKRPARPDNLSIAEKVDGLKNGQFAWAAKAAPSGPMVMIINLGTQRAVLFRGGVAIAASTISTGSEGRETPTGTFTILQKEVVHRSRTYDDASMPYMQRLTWKGVSMHAGALPGRPASHGCIRLPPGFAKLLYGITNLGMPVVITDEPVTPTTAPPVVIATAVQAPADLPSGTAAQQSPVEIHR